MGAALTYARRYALFALVGISGEDDLDAPDVAVEPSQGAAEPTASSPAPRVSRKPSNGSLHQPRQKPPLLSTEASVVLRDELIAEIKRLQGNDDLALWAHRRLPAKNTLASDYASAVDVAFQSVLDAVNSRSRQSTSEASDPSLNFTPRDDAPRVNGAETIAGQPSTEMTVTPLRKAVRRRNKAHLAFVGAQPCLVCRRSPCDAHHLKFAQPRALGRKVSDEFTVPLCREHHGALHRHGNEIAWWANLQIAPIESAKELWSATMLGTTVVLGKDPRQPHGNAAAD